MEEFEKEMLEKLKDFDIKQLFKKDTYVEFLLHDNYNQCYITDTKGDGKCILYIPSLGGRTELPINKLNFYCENEYHEKKRNDCINNDLLEKEPEEIIDYMKEKMKSFNVKNSNKNNILSKKGSKVSISSTSTSSSNKNQGKNNNNKNRISDKNGKLDDSGYEALQFFNGYLVDILVIIYSELTNDHFNNSLKALFILVLDTIIYVGEVVKSNLKYYKTAYYYRKLSIVSQIHAILISYDSLIYNLIQYYMYNYSHYNDLDSRLSEIVNTLYEILLISKEKCNIPLPCLIIFIKFIIFNNVKEKIIKFDKKTLYNILTNHLKNLNENELKYFRRNSDMKENFSFLVRNMYNNDMKILIYESIYCYYLSCLKCKNLEKKMNALNDISEIINEFQGKTKIDLTFKNFIEKYKILDIFFEESIHDEIIKRSFNLFKYFAKFDLLSDNIIEKIIARQANNDLMKKLLIEIVSDLPRKKKDILFKRLSNGIKFNDNINNIEYISKLTESCFNYTKNGEETKQDNTNNYYGLIMIFDYIIKDFDDKKKYNENNVDMAIDSFVHTISKIIKYYQFEIDDVFFFIDKLFDNIKSNNKYNSVIQSIKLIQKLLIIISQKKNNTSLIQNLKKLDEKYDIITLLLNDLIRYMKLLPNDYTNELAKEKIYEGIYPHNVNIEERLKLIFYFFKKSENNYGLLLKGKKHIEKIYQLFKPEKYKEEQKKFYEIFTRNISEIDDLILMEFFKDILQNKEEFNLKEIKDNESINLIIKTFKNVNENNGALLYDGRNIRIEGGSDIEGFDMLFELLTENPDKNVQNQISQLLCDICLSFKDYNNPNIPNYWKIYFNKITQYLNNINKSNDKVAFNGIIKLLNKIYSFCSNCNGKIPEKHDYNQQNQEQSKLYHFQKTGPKKEKEYRLRAGNNDRIIDMRWKLGYYYDIPVNNVTFIDLAGKRYSLNNDFEIFTKIFSHEKYFLSENFAFIKVDEVPFQLLQMKNNPKSLIEENELIYNILIDNLRIDNINDNDINVQIENKQKIWNIISKLPKYYYFTNKFKKFGKDEALKENELIEILDINELYILTYSLQCFYYFLFDKKNENDKKINQVIPDKKEYLNNFIGIHHGDKILLDTLLNIKIDSNNCNPIKIECLNIIIDVLNEIELYKQNEKETKFENFFDDKDLFNNSLNILTNIISNLLELNYTKYKNYLIQGSDDINDHNTNNNGNKININENISKLIENIFAYIEIITKDKMPYMKYVFNKSELFTKIFVYDYIKCESDESRKTIDEYLMKNYIKNKDYIKKYFEIILTVDIFNYLVKNDKSGKYFHVISSILKKYYEDNNINDKDNQEEKGPKDNIIETKHIIQSKQIIDIILDYILNECEKKEDNNENIEEKEAKILMKNKENFKEGIVEFLTNILNLNQKELVKYIINKVDICDLFLNKCSLRKCIDKPLETQKPFCLTNQSQNAVYKLLFVVLKNIQNNDLYIKIVKYLNKFHQIGFWKTRSIKNWELESREMQKGKYVGLKNMTATCYLNSIIQQLFMIPMFRETILKINNSSKNNVLYELQLLFSALKIYEFAYYDPRSFVIINKLNFYEQMDADEFYGTLIDKIENDIKKLYLKKPTSTPEDTRKDKGDSTKEPKNENYKYKDIFNYFFGIKVLDELKFVDCGHKRYNEFCYNSIQLEIKEFNNIHESLKNYFKTEIMEGDNKINCEQCKIKRTCHKHLIFKSLPNILVIVLKRFEFDYNTMLKYKLNKYFEFPYKLDMKEYLIENHKELNTEYELTGITIHFGISDYGHYYDLIKGPDNKWYKFNDIFVSEFKEEDIPKEAFGEKEIFEEDSYKEKENGKNNAYILIYKKVNFENEIIDKKNESDLALPPFDKFSNINDDIKNEINSKLFKSWTIRNITSTVYQNFILSLLKLDIVKIIDSNIEKSYPKLIKSLKNDGLLFGNNNENNKTPDINNNVFEFALRYYFWVLLRTSRKVQDKTNNFSIFKEIIKVYLETDINKAKFLLEEFSNIEALDEYLIYCPNRESISDCINLILFSFDLIYENNNKSNDSFIYEFINTLIIYIDNNINQINLDGVNALFLEIFKKDEQKFFTYLKKKSYDKWVLSFFGNGGRQEIIKKIMNENIFPVLHSQHSILVDKTNNLFKKELFDKNDIYEQHFLNRLKDDKSNRNLIEQLGHIFINDQF